MYHWLGFIREDWEEKSALLSLKWNLGFVNLGNSEIQTAPNKYQDLLLVFFCILASCESWKDFPFFMTYHLL